MPGGGNFGFCWMIKLLLCFGLDVVLCLGMFCCVYVCMPYVCMHLSLIDSERAYVGGNTSAFQTSVKYLGLHLDQTLSMQQQSFSLRRAASLELRSIASIRPFPIVNATAKLTCFIHDNLDYCMVTMITAIASLLVCQLNRLRICRSYRTMLQDWS